MDYTYLINNIERCQAGDCYIIERVKTHIENFCEDNEIEKDTKTYDELIAKVWFDILSDLKYESFADIGEFSDYLD